MSWFPKEAMTYPSAACPDRCWGPPRHNSHGNWKLFPNRAKLVVLKTSPLVTISSWCNIFKIYLYVSHICIVSWLGTRDNPSHITKSHPNSTRFAKPIPFRHTPPTLLRLILPYPILPCLNSLYFFCVVGEVGQPILSAGRCCSSCISPKIHECGAVGGMRIGGINQSTKRKPVSAPLYLPQIPHYLTWDRTRASVVWNRQLTAWVMALLYFVLLYF
jgi:hypothetical protein